VHFQFLCSAQFAKCDLARVGIRVRVRFKSEICNLRMRDFEIAQRILEIVQIDKPRATITYSGPVDE